MDGAEFELRSLDECVSSEPKSASLRTLGRRMADESPPRAQSHMRRNLLMLLCLSGASSAFAHGVAQGDKGYIQEVTGAHLVPFAYLGAKHMATGYDDLLSLGGVTFSSSAAGGASCPGHDDLQPARRFVRPAK